MSRLSYSLVGIVLAAQPALADVTPRQVWDDWLASAQEGDAEIATTSVDDSGGRVVVRGLTLTSGTEEDGRYAVEVDEVTLEQNPDGTVAVSASPSYPIQLTERSEDGKVQQTRLLVEHPDFEMTVADAAGVRVHSFAAPLLRITVEETLIDGEPLDLEGAATLTDVAGRYDVGGGDEGQSALTIAGTDFSLRGTDPETGGRFEVDADLTDVETRNLLQLLGPDPAAMVRAMPEGASREASMRTGGSSFRFASDNAGETAALSGTMGPATTLVSLSRAGVRYETRTEGGQAAVSGSSIPLPEVTVGVGEFAVTLLAPLVADAAAQPFAFSVSMIELVLDEGLWNMVDPAGVLPRDAGELVVDVAGDVIVADDIDPTGVTDSPPGEVQNVDINALRLSIAEAELAAQGQLEMTGPDGTVPVGEIEVTLNGAALLLERLVQVGIVPQDQAAAAQMMMTMFAQPGPVEGQLVSRIRLAEDGSVFVNDQQVR